MLTCETVNALEAAHWKLYIGKLDVYMEGMLDKGRKPPPGPQGLVISEARFYRCMREIQRYTDTQIHRDTDRPVKFMVYVR